MGLELKLLADVGLLGFPNAGKSTLISRISRAKPKVADYPFTTLVPNLGVVSPGGEESFVVADIPGLVAGASEGIGLGHRFLRHVERCGALIFLLAAVDETEPEEAWHILRKELGQYAADLLERPSCVALGKSDALGEDAQSAASALAASLGTDVIPVSGVTRLGIPVLLDRVAALLPRSESNAAPWEPTA